MPVLLIFLFSCISSIYIFGISIMHNMLLLLTKQDIDSRTIPVAGDSAGTGSEHDIEEESGQFNSFSGMAWILS